MSAVLIRKAIPGDEAAIHHAHMRSIREVCVKDHGADEIKGWGYRPLGDRWLQPVAQGAVWVAELKGIIGGFGFFRGFETNGAKAAHLHGLYLTPELVGQGIGYKLAQLMLADARAYGARTVTLESSLTAHEFYKRLGFVDTGDMMRVEINGYPVRCFPMALSLVGSDIV